MWNQGLHPLPMAGSDADNGARTIGGKSFNLRILLVIAISALVLAGILGVSTLHSVVFTNYSTNEALQRLDDVAEAIAAKTERLLEPATVIARHALGETFSNLKTRSGDDRQHQFDRFLEGMDIAPVLHPQIYGVYLGYPDGSSANLTWNSPELLELAALPSEITSPYLRLKHDASDPDARDVWAHEVDGAWKAIVVPTMGFDPRTRPWYRIAKDHREPVWTGLYRFLVEGTAISKGKRPFNRLSPQIMLPASAPLAKRLTV